MQIACYPHKLVRCAMTRKQLRGLTHGPHFYVAKPHVYRQLFAPVWHAGCFCR